MVQEPRIAEGKAFPPTAKFDKESFYSRLYAKPAQKSTLFALYILNALCNMAVMGCHFATKELYPNRCLCYQQKEANQMRNVLISRTPYMI